MNAKTNDVRRVLAACVAIDRLAVMVYARMSELASDLDLRDVFRAMQADEEQHVEWWMGLTRRLDEGELVVPWDDIDELADRIESVVRDVEESVPADLTGLSDRDMLLIATKIEYFALEPEIGELADMVELRDVSPKEQYDEHLERLMQAIEGEGHLDDSLSLFLVRVLRRAWHNAEAMTLMALHDPQTGLFNRRALSAFLPQALAVATRYGQPVAVLMMDVDDFKTINDRYGHEIGDRAIELVADAVSSSTRSADVCARFGGDEFIVVAPHTDSAQASTLAERIELAVMESTLSTPRRDARVTVSIGVAVYEPEPDDKAPTSDSMLSRADYGLYRAKAAGKARCAEPLRVLSAA